MKNTTRAFYCIFLLWLGCVCGCSPQKILAHRLKGADRVVVTNTIDGLSISVTGADVDKIVRAIAAGKKESPTIATTPGLRLEFFRDAEHLETVFTSYQVFWVEHTPYVDTTEALKTLYERFREEHPPMFSP